MTSMLYLRSLAHDPFGDGANGNRNRKVGIQYPSWAVRPSPRRQISRGHWSTAASVVGSNNSLLTGLGLICLRTWRHFSRKTVDLKRLPTEGKDCVVSVRLVSTMQRH